MTNREFFDRTAQVHDVNLPMGASSVDVELAIRLHAERIQILCPAIRYFRLDKDRTKVDPDYDDSSKPAWDGLPDPTTGKVVGRAILVPVEVHFDPPQKLLRRYGIEIQHQALLVMSCRILDELKVEPKTGDRWELLGTFYEANTVKFVDYILQTQIPLSCIATVEQKSVT